MFWNLLVSILTSIYEIQNYPTLWLSLVKMSTISTVHEKSVQSTTFTENAQENLNEGKITLLRSQFYQKNEALHLA